METKSYTTLDRSKWGPGPWDGEPDKVQWPDFSTGLPCLAVRHPFMGNLCGYVGVKESHPLYNKPYQECEALVDVHGGLTYSEACDLGAPLDQGICYEPGPGDTDRIWWLGFDCGHAWDLKPGMGFLTAGMPPLSCEETYRTLAYVQAQCADLAQQLRAMELCHG